MSSCEEI